MRQHYKDKLAELPPSLEELFVSSVQAAIEVAHMLGMTGDDFAHAVKEAWKIDGERNETRERENKT